MRKEVKIFRNFPAASIFARKLKKGKRVKIFKTILAEHIKFLPESLKRRKSGHIFPKFSCRTRINC